MGLSELYIVTGYVENFKVADFGNGFITVTWDYVAGSDEYPLHKYSLLIDNDLTSEFKCSDATCSKTITDLESCVEHVFDLTPIFYTPTGEDTTGDVATTSGYTEAESESLSFFLISVFRVV